MGAAAAVVEKGGRMKRSLWNDVAWRCLPIIAVLVLAGCAGPNPLVGTMGRSGVAGFWSGLWHGMICPIAFGISLFNHAFTMYEVHNNGNWYNLGFMLGAGAWGILGGRSSSSSK
jgi:hypothetical protein